MGRVHCDDEGFRNLPNGALAIVEIPKLRASCLNLHHPRGRKKARVIASVGIREADAEELQSALREAAATAPARLVFWNV